MNLRKIILIFTLGIFVILMYLSFMSFTALSQAASAQGVGLATLVGGINALLVWLQFPLSIVIAIILIYLILADASLTQQNTKK
jgi:hypothetical protein